MERMKQNDKEYGIPEQKKFPLDTRAHVVSAVKFFNYAAPRYRKALANRIIRKINEYGISLTPSDDNDFYNYYHPEVSHSGINGMKWYKRRWQYKDGTYTPDGRVHYADSIKRYHDFIASRKGFGKFEDLRDEYNDTRLQDIEEPKESFIERILKELF